MSIPQLNDAEKTIIATKHLDFSLHVDRARYTTIVAVSLLVPALIVIACSGLCFTLTNNISNIIYKGMLPACGAILLSLPFIYLTVKEGKEKKRLREEWVPELHHLIDQYGVLQLTEDEQVKFLKEQFFISAEDQKRLTNKEPSSMSLYYRSSILDDLKPRYDKGGEKYEEKSTIIKALDKAKAELQEDNAFGAERAQKKRDKREKEEKE